MVVSDAPRAIETVYKGYRFRSRLEARWAVFFDKLGIKYEYEKEGFDLGEHGRYLPDFWLPKMGIWCEVKSSEGFDEVASKKLIALVQHTGWPALAVAGMPHERSMVLRSDRADFVEFRMGLSLDFCYEPLLVFCDWPGRPASWSIAITSAEDAAKSARFEFGESGD